MAKVGFRIDTIEPACPDQSIYQGTTLASVAAAEEDIDGMTFKRTG